MAFDAVLDASAFLALIRGEPGAEVVGEYRRTALSSVNLTETVSRLIDLGMTPDAAVDVVDYYPTIVLPFDRDLALRASALRDPTRRFGLSLGDCACLALAMRESLPVLTTDRVWTSLDLNIQIRLIR